MTDKRTYEQPTRTVMPQRGAAECRCIRQADAIERVLEVERELRFKRDQRNEWAQEIGIDQDTRHGYIVARNVYGIAADMIAAALRAEENA